MKRNCLLTIAGLWLLLAAFPAAAVTLRYSLKEGAELTYRVQVASASRMSGLEDEKIEVKTRLEQTFRLKVTKVMPDKKMEIEQEVLSGKLSLSIEGEEAGGPLARGKRKLKLSPLGRVLPGASRRNKPGDNEVGKAPGVPPLMPLGLSDEAAQMDFLMPSVFIPLPEKDVQPGDIWENVIKLEAATGGEDEPLVLKVKSKLLGITEKNGSKLAHIRTKYEIGLSNEESAQGPLGLEAIGKIAGETECYFDYENSCTSTAEGTLQMFLKISSEAILDEEEAEGGGVIKANLKTLLLKK